jgi:hypothetical protein
VALVLVENDNFVAIPETASEFHDVGQTHIVKRGDIDGFKEEFE